VTLYDARGEFAGVRRLGSGNPITVEGVTITAEQVVAATGLELKADPGVPLVYAGFGGEPAWVEASA
jgi:cytochrome c biogenesis protein